MAYKKQNFQDGQVLKAEHLNKIEDGIKAVEEYAGDLQPAVENLQSAVGNLQSAVGNLQPAVANLQPITSTIDITAGSTATSGRPYHVIE